jgi:hypothetical protein
MRSYFHLSTYEERDNNFITLADNLYGGPLIYCAYLNHLCPACRSIDRAALFARKHGLEGGPKIRVSKGRELAGARDGFLLIKSRVLELLQKHRVGGYSTRPIPYTEWHAFRVTHRVPYKEFSPKRDQEPCQTCARGAYYGTCSLVREIAVPDADNTFFAPELERTNTYDVYLTESVADLLKSEGVKGGLLTRLLSDEECRIFREGTPAARRKIKNQHVYLA